MSDNTRNTGTGMRSERLTHRRLRRLVCALTRHKPFGPVYADVLNLGIKARQCERCGRMVTG